MQQAPVFTGVGVAIVTFFDEHGHVDAAATARHAAAPPARPRTCR